MFTRGSSTDKQSHYYGFSHQVRVSLAPGGATGTIKANLGAYGRIDLTFAAGGGGRTTPGCPEALLFQHAGTLAGTVHFVSHSSYLGTIDKSSVRGYTATGQKGINCKPPTHKLPHGTTLDALARTTSGTPPAVSLVDFSVGRDLKGHIQESFTVIELPSGRTVPTIIHAIDRSSLPPSAFTNASDLSSARARASGKFISGTLTYTSAVMLSPTQTVGSVSGSIVAHFDGLPPVALPTPSATTANLAFSP